ncbi:MAG: class I SAM-dependent rRNA methyltransferase, partial [Bacteroidota bacterium]|nr:class I SAM-dependent rRNA methyltransferase [Bacteroidota bacterium]
MKYTQVILKPGKEQSMLRFHPWVFSGAIKKIKGDVREGEVVEVFSHEKQFLGIGHYQIGSIAVRIFSFVPVQPDLEYWKFKLASAFELRRRLGLTANPETNVYRLVHGE